MAKEGGIALEDREGTLARLRRFVPEGRTLPEQAWRHRHHGMIGLLLAESVALAIFGVAQGVSVPHAIGEAMALVPIAALDPSAVYNHPAAVAHPWRWAAVHGAFVFAAGIAAVAAWRLNETLRAQEQESYRRALASEERFRGAFEHAPVGMVLFAFGAGGVEIDQVNQAMCDLTGHSRERLHANGFEIAVDPEDAPEVIDGLMGLLDGGEGSVDLELRILHAGGETRRAVASVSLLHAEPDGRGYAIAQVSDVTERRLVAEELIHQALHDPLTGLGNRRSLLADLDLRMLEATTARPLLLLLFDLDGFKTYNDTYGHPAGDSLLLRMATRLETALAGRATAYRVGGDEFCVLSLTEAVDRDAIAALAAAALMEQGEGFTITASFGAVRLPEEAATATDALREADRRMYERKSADSRSSAGRQSADVLLRILSERSPALGVHLDEVTGLCDAVAVRLDLAEDERAPLLQAASLHDAGKIAIPDEILQKPGPLDDEEWVFVRRHTVVGERILGAAPALARAGRLAIRTASPATRSRWARGSSRCATPTARWSPTVRTALRSIQPPRARSCCAAPAPSSTPRWWRSCARCSTSASATPPSSCSSTTVGGSLVQCPPVSLAPCS